MRPGPAPTPTKLRLLKGETKPSRINRAEPQPRDAPPEAPAWLTTEAKAIFDRVLRELKPMHLVYAVDATALAMYADALARYLEAKSIVDRAGVVIKGRDGGLVVNPACRVERDRARDVHRFGSDFGLTPSARVSLGTKPEWEPSELERLLSW